MDLFLDEFIANEAFRWVVPWACFRGLIRPIAGNVLSWKAVEKVGPLVVAINGGAQGTGKSTLSRFLSDFFRVSAGLNACVLSLDDLYLSRADRLALGSGCILCWRLGGFRGRMIRIGDGFNKDFHQWFRRCGASASFS